MADALAAPDALHVVQRYHQRSKHALNAYAAGPETLDWDAQPNPFRRYAGAPTVPLPLGAELPSAAPAVPWAGLFTPGHVPPQPLTLATLGGLFEFSLALAAWKQSGPDRWAVRINPSSGNLHPTEGWLLTRGVPALADGVHHYAPHEHALELRAEWSCVPDPDAAAVAPRAWLALSSIAWREAWKYGERAFRYCQLDAGHAIGALRYAAALQGWCLRPVPVGTADLAALLGLDREADFGLAEREEPDALFELLASDGSALPDASAPSSPPRPLDSAGRGPGLPAALWHGQANRLDRHPMYRWPVIGEVTVASRTGAARGADAASPGLSAAALAAPSGTPAATPTADPATPAAIATSPSARAPDAAAAVIRQRRSAQRFDAKARLPAAALWPLLQALQAQRPPFDAGPARPQVHVLLFAHRVDGLPPGAYLLARSGNGERLLRHNLPAALDWAPVAEAPADVPLWRLADNPALAGTLRTLNCHQALGSDAILGFALLAEFNPLPDAAAYRERLQEAGLIGQVLYLEAEAMGLRGTGIGCFFDDALHQLIGLPLADAASAPLQSVYHFTIGRPLDDARIVSEPPYAHLPPWPRDPAPSGVEP
jgi:SagB-type dehydrogenase family enzyme